MPITVSGIKKKKNKQMGWVRDSLSTGSGLHLVMLMFLDCLLFNTTEVEENCQKTGENRRKYVRLEIMQCSDNPKHYNQLYNSIFVNLFVPLIIQNIHNSKYSFL